MPSKMSLFNKELILQIGRSTGWVSIVYFLGLLFTLPMRIFMNYSDENFIGNQRVETLFHYDFDIQITLIIIVPVILAVFLFRFLHVKQATDLMHSLPLKRERIFHHYGITGIVFLGVPVAVISIIILIMHTTLDLSSMFSVKDILYWSGTTIVITLLLYTAGVFIAMMTGISAVQAVLAYIFLLFPVGIMLLLFYNLKILLYGFPSDYFLNRQIERLSPITFAAGLDTRAFHWNDAVLYLILTVILYVFALFFYKKRKLEAASEAIAFPKLRLVFKYGIAFCAMLLGGAYFSEISYRSLGWTLIGYVIGTVFGYFLAEMVLQKTWRVYGKVKGLVVYLAAIGFLVIGMQTLGIYENRVPEENEIKNVILTDNPNIYLNDEMYSEYYTPKPMKEKANIEVIRKLHKQFIADKRINQERQNDRSKTFFIRYELKSGNYFTREYSVNQRLYDDFFKPIYETNEYKLTTKEIFNLKVNKIKTLSIRANGPVNKAVTLSNPIEVKEAISALRADVLAESYEDSVYFQSSGAMVEVSVGKDHYINLDFKPNYLKFTEWLKEKKLLDQAKVTADDISHVLVAKGDFSNMNDPEKIKSDVEKSGDSLDIVDKGQIERLQNNGSLDSDKEYAAIFYYHFGNYFEVMYFDEDHAPDFLKKHLK